MITDGELSNIYERKLFLAFAQIAFLKVRKLN